MTPDLKQIQNTPNDALLTPIQVAKLVGLSAQAIRRKIKHGEIPSVNVAGRIYMNGAGLKKMVIFTDIV